MIAIDNNQLITTNTVTMQWQIAATPPQDNGQQLVADGLTIDDLIACCQAYDAWKRDHEIKAVDFRLHDNGRFSTGNEEGCYILEDSALTQMCARYGKPFFGGALPREYTRADRAASWEGPRGRPGIKLKQTGDRRTKLMLLIAAMGEALGACGDLIQRMVQAQYDELPALDQIIDGLAERFEWSQELTFAVVHGTENQRTIAGLVNGLTYAAHAVAMPAQQAVSLEMLGGKVLMAAPRDVRQFVQ